MAPLQSPVRPHSPAPPTNPSAYFDTAHAERPATRAARPRKGPDPFQQPQDEWQERGACRAESPSLFFAPDHESPHQRRLRESAAKAICSKCPVRTACRAYAVQTGELYGIWGGTTERERAHHPHSRPSRADAGAKTA